MIANMTPFMTSYIFNNTELYDYVLLVEQRFHDHLI